MSTGRHSTAYSKLLTRVAPRVIRSEAENERYIQTLYELEQRGRTLTSEEKEFADLLTLLIENFEDTHYRLPRAAPVEVLSFLMDQHGLKQKDLLDVFGSRSIVSEILNGRREMTKEHIRRLSERFHVSPEVFF